MSDIQDASAEYLVQRFGGTLMPTDEDLVAWLNERAAEGWRLVTVDDGVGYLERSPAGTQTQSQRQ